MTNSRISKHISLSTSSPKDFRSLCNPEHFSNNHNHETFRLSFIARLRVFGGKCQRRYNVSCAFGQKSPRFPVQDPFVTSLMRKTTLMTLSSISAARKWIRQKVGHRHMLGHRCFQSSHYKVPLIQRTQAFVVQNLGAVRIESLLPPFPPSP